MASKLTHYKAFIASPGGLEKERHIFRNTIEAHNEADGIPRGVIFTPIGWEITLKGVGRPQEIINNEVRSCDYFILVLWDRWGSAPDNNGRFSSGTEEEYQVALECYRSSELPMRQIVVLFKTVEPRQLSDPGEQLSKVIRFKKLLEKEKAIFYDSFDDAESLEKKLRKYLAAWTRDHEAGSSPVNFEEETSGDASNEDKEGEESDSIFSRPDMKYRDRNSENSFVNEAERLLSKGKITEAEAKLVHAIMPGDDMVAFRTYGQFLIESNRLTDAEAIYDRMYEIAFEVKELSWAGTALAAIGGIYRIRKNYLKAAKLLGDAYKLKESARDITGMMHVAIWQGDLCMNFNKLSEAKKHYEQAYEIATVNGWGAFQLKILEKMGKVAARDKDHNLSSSTEVLISKVKADLEEEQALEKLKAEAVKKGLRGKRQ